MLRLSTLFTATCLLLSSAFVSAQSSSTSDLYADTSCVSDLCLKVIYSPSERRYNMTMSANGGSPMGWYSVGTGTKMAGSNMMIGWVDTSGNVIMSQRTTTSGHSDPTTTIEAAAATMQEHNSFSNSSGTVWAWSFPMSSSETPSSSTNFIWAANKGNNPSSSTSSHLKKHTDYGTLTLDLTKPYSAAAASSEGTANGQPVTPATGGSLNQQNSDRTLNYSNKMIIAHMVMMIVAWFILVPAGILIGRYGRTFFKWLPYHRAVLIVAFVLVLIGFILIVVEVQKGGGGHFNNTHGKAGLAIFIIMFCQILIGFVGRRFKRFNPTRIVHVVIGLGVTVVAVWNSTEGLQLWQWAPPQFAQWILWIWAGVLLLAYLIGLAFLPRDLREWKQAQRETAIEEKQGYLGLQNAPSSGTGSPGVSTQQHSPGEAPPMHPGWGAPPRQAGPAPGYETYPQQVPARGSSQV